LHKIIPIGIVARVQIIDMGSKYPSYQPYLVEAAPMVYMATADPILPDPSIIPVTVDVTDLLFPLPFPISALQVDAIVLFTLCRNTPKKKNRVHKLVYVADS